MDGQLKELRWTNSHSNVQPPFDSVRVQRIQRGRFCASPVTIYCSSAQWVGLFKIGSGRVQEKILGSGSASGRVGVLNYKIGYFRVISLL